MIRFWPLRDAATEHLFGGKAVSLGRLLRSGLPAPGGYVLDAETVASLTPEPSGAILDSMAATLAEIGGRAAVRSSAVGEDAGDASFAGQHATILNVTSAASMLEAILAVRQSAHTPSALSYRKRLGIAGTPRMAVVLQRLIRADKAGVLFTRNPSTGADVRVIEAAWGLGESVVSGAVVPDSYTLSRDGRILERTIGEKDVAVQALPSGGSAEVAVDPSRVHAPVLSDSELLCLQDITVQCEKVFGNAIDIEWAFESGDLYLLQCRAITRAG